MLDIDRKYIGFVSIRLDRYKVKSTIPYRANCRCKICGDSKKSQAKARGWLLEKDNRLTYYCHNCGASMSFSNFLKTLFPSLYNEYIVDRKLTGETKKKLPESTNKFKYQPPKFAKKGSPLNKISKISSLPHSHFAKRYVESRKIPAKQHYRLYYTDNFAQWTNTIIPDKLKEVKHDHRLVLPFVDCNGNLIGYQGRALKGNDNLRYITIMTNPEHNDTKIFGLDKVNFNREYYVLEGPIDSLFFNNAVAMAGSDGKLDMMKNIHNAVFVYDMEPRNKAIVNKMRGRLKEGHKVAMLPYDRLHEYGKDINDFILNGMSIEQIEATIYTHTFSGLEGEFELQQWSKCE